MKGTRNIWIWAAAALLCPALWAQAKPISTGAIQGVVLDENGRPIQEVNVKALHSILRDGVRILAVAGSAKTDDRGQYRLFGLDPGSFLLRVSADDSYRASKIDKDIAATYYPNAGEPSRASRVQVAAAETTRADFRLPLRTKRRLSGSVLREGAASANSYVSIRSCVPGQIQEPALQTAATLQKDNTFETSAIPPGTYCVTFSERDPNFRVQAFAGEIVTLADNDVKGIRLSPVPSREIRGTLRIEPAAQVEMFRSVRLAPARFPSEPILTGRLDSQSGDFVISAFTTQYRLLSLTTQGAYIKSVRLGDQDVTSGSLDLSGEVRPLVIEIAAARGRLTGQVDLSSGTPVDQIQVTLAPEGALNWREDRIRTVALDAEGRFALTDLAPGAYKVIAWERDDPDYVQWPEFQRLFAGTIVTVSDAQEQKIAIGTISAREIDEAKSRF